MALDGVHGPGGSPKYGHANKEPEEKCATKWLTMALSGRGQPISESPGPAPFWSGPAPGSGEDDERRHDHGIDGELEGFDKLVTACQAGQRRDGKDDCENHASGEPCSPQLVKSGHGPRAGGPCRHRVGRRWKKSQKQTSRKKPRGIAKVNTCGPMK